MKAMANHRTHSIEFKRQVAQEFLAGETLHGLSKRHDICRNLIRVWVQKYEAGAFDEDVRPPICSSSMRHGSQPLSGLSASRHWNWSS
jgi:transposase